MPGRAKDTFSQVVAASSTTCSLRSRLGTLNRIQMKRK